MVRNARKKLFARNTLRQFSSISKCLFFYVFLMFINSHSDKKNFIPGLTKNVSHRIFIFFGKCLFENKSRFAV